MACKPLGCVQDDGRPGGLNNPAGHAGRVMTEACDVMPSCPRSKPGFLALQLRIIVSVSILAWVAACAHNGPRLSATQEAAQYQSRARGNYAPPGPPSDPWGPYIVEASHRYDVPEPWIRQVMRVESSGRVMDTSSAGAMGLMQVMPQTYDELRGHYQLGDDPYDPHDNVMAGTAYLREMYDIYGFPGFLAAYNAGPARLDDYLMHNRPLPDETRHYVAKIAPYIVGIEPNQPSQAAAYAMNQVPIDIPPGPRYPRRSPAPLALAANQPSRSAPQRTVQTASLVAPSLPVPPSVGLTPAPAPRGGGFHLISPAMAETLPASRAAGGTVSGSWAIQVGAFGNESQARAAADAAKGQARELLGHAQPMVGTVHPHATSATLYRARLTGLSRDAAVQACERIGHGHGHNGCIVLSPEAQS
jgi:soluble lytic murein transglycosylase-like protein